MHLICLTFFFNIFTFYFTDLSPNQQTTNLPTRKPSINKKSRNTPSNTNTNATKSPGVVQPQHKPQLTRSRSFVQQEHPKNVSYSKRPPSITVGLRPQLEVVESSNPLEFKVIYLGEPCPAVTWKKNEVPISDDQIIKHKNNCSTLVLDPVLAEDSGLYSCSVENVQGKVETFCQLTVMPKSSVPPLTSDEEVPNGQQHILDSPMKKHSFKPCPPTIIDHLKSVQAEDGTEIELSCKIVCPSSSFDVVWIHNGKEIRPSQDFQYHHSESTYSLKIPELFPEDSGIYTCEAFNDFGEAFTSCSLYVNIPGVPDPVISDVFKTFPKSVSVTRGAPVVVYGELTPQCNRQVSWFKDQVLVDQTMSNEQGRVQFSIVEAGPRDTGLYELHTILNGEEHRAAFAINVL